jgi:hypothetical protein
MHRHNLGRAQKHLIGTLLAAACLLASQRAEAGLTLSGSVGVGGQVSPNAQFQATNLMLAPGYDFLGFVRPELGFVGTLEQVRAGNYLNVGWELRPMVVLTAPLIPLYARLIFAAVDPFSSTNRAYAYGGALGVGFALVGLGVFAEAGALPRSVQNTMSWVIEGRAGVYVGL